MSFSQWHHEFATRKAEAWRYDDHVLYKLFSFLYQNWLWKKEVPTRYSLCPYFHLAMFSLFIFMPFIFMPLALGKSVYVLLFKVFGKVIKTIDYWLIGCLARLVGEPCPEKGKYDGMGIGITTLVACLTWIVSYGLGSLSALYQTTILYDVNYLVAFWGLISGLLVYLFVKAYEGISNISGNAKACKVIAYFYVWAIAFTVVAFYYSHANVLFSLSVIWGLIVYLLLVIWGGISWLFSAVVGILTVTILGWKLWMVLLSIGAINLLFLWTMCKLAERMAEKDKHRILSKEEVILHLKVCYVMDHIDDEFQEIACMLMERGDLSFDKKNGYKVAMSVISRKMFDRVFEELWDDVGCFDDLSVYDLKRFDKLHIKAAASEKKSGLSHRPRVTSIPVAFARSGMPMEQVEFLKGKVNQVARFLFNDYLMPIGGGSKDVVETIKEMSTDPDLQKDYEELVALYSKEKEEVKGPRFVWLHDLCLKITGSIMAVFGKAGDVIEAGWEATTDVISVGIQVAKGKKKGICPLVEFKKRSISDK